MTTDATGPRPAAPPPAEAWPPLSVNERRVLGVLVEKAKTTPDAYPMTLNALITGSNQKSNRDPVLNLTDAEIEEALGTLKKKLLAQQILGSGRTDKYRHILYDTLRVDKVELAILGELLLRGPQTEGELRTRASRMEPIADLDELRPKLRGLAQRKLVVYLTPEGRRGTMVTHGFHPPEELERVRSKAERLEAEAPAVPAPAPAALAAVAAAPPPPAPDLGPRLAALETAVRELRAVLEELRGQVEAVRADHDRLAAELRG